MTSEQGVEVPETHVHALGSWPGVYISRVFRGQVCCSSAASTPPSSSMGHTSAAEQVTGRRDRIVREEPSRLCTSAAGSLPRPPPQLH